MSKTKTIFGEEKYREHFNVSMILSEINMIVHIYYGLFSTHGN